MHNGKLDDSGRYPGGKSLSGVWQWIVSRMPTHSLYIEPFAGKAAIARHKPPALETILIDRDRAVTDWLKNLAVPGSIVINSDGISWLRSNAWAMGPDALVYCDPPYMLRTRTKKRLYRFEMADEDHVRLLNVVTQMRCRVMISGYWSTIYADKLHDWHSEKRAVTTRGRTMRDEWLWCNFDPRSVVSSELSVRYHSLAGDYRERERINRKITRWRKRFAAMPAAERNAVVRALLDEAARASSAPAVKTSK